MMKRVFTGAIITAVFSFATAIICNEIAKADKLKKETDEFYETVNKDLEEIAEESKFIGFVQV